MKSVLKRFMTDEEWEEFNRIKEATFPDTRPAINYMASLDLYSPTDLELGIEDNETEKQ